MSKVVIIEQDPGVQLWVCGGIEYSPVQRVIEYRAPRDGLGILMWT